MQDKYIIIDPRSFILSDNFHKKYEIDFIKKTLSRNQLYFATNHKECPISISQLLEMIIDSFPSDYIFFLSDESNKKKQKEIIEFIKPEKIFLGDIFISKYSDVDVNRVVNFIQHFSWKDWIIAIFSLKKYYSFEKAINDRLSFANRQDPLHDFVEYSIHINPEFGDISVLVNKEEIFDAFIKKINDVFN